MQEVGHFVAAFRKKFKSIIPDRSTKVDTSLAGPFAGAGLSLSMFAVGLLLSSNPNATGELVQVPGMLFQGSLLLGLISRATLGYAYVLPLPLYHYLTGSSLYVSYETSMQSFFN
ncbi:hypothetical protein C1H46_034205 [Malus baccata]|uniref:Uncharacterized protein n=1 Tax=Malus baccata TaxID=106549 RepID=A0A540L158_MALBA|nr:hypothetical protein C1H46_034205 [Malus baccata]